MKKFTSTDYNYIFNAKNGFFARWGRTTGDDPLYCLYGPEILDLELSTICSGVNGKVCDFCYKANTSKGKNMSFETFKTILNKIPETLTQVAFGIGNVDANSDMFKIMEYCRKKNIVPNITINGDRLTYDIVNKLSKLLGAIAISNYDKDICYNAVKRFTDAGLIQTNIHQFVSEETYDNIMQLFRDYKTDKRLHKLNAIVLLSLKQKGRGIRYTPLAFDRFKSLIDYAFENDIPIGFDSCSCRKFEKCLNEEQKERYEMMCEPCESALFSAYINVDGCFFPCSFMEGESDWHIGLDVVNCNDFVKDIWMNERTLDWRKRLLANNRNCPCFVNI